MKKNLFFILFLSAICILTYGCGKDDVEIENSDSAVESSLLDDLESETDVTTVSSEKSKSTTVSTTVTTVTTQTATTAVITSVSGKVTATAMDSGETKFQLITGEHAHYDSRTPSVLTPHEPVIYTTAPSGETTSTQTSSTETTTSTVTDTTGTDTTETTLPPDPLKTEEMYFNEIKLGENAQEMISALGEPIDIKTSPSDYYIDDIQGEDRHYYFENIEIVACCFEDNAILKEVIIRSPEYSTSRGLAVGMSLADAEQLYGKDYISDDNGTFTYTSDSQYNDEKLYFHIENDVIDYIGFSIVLT